METEVINYFTGCILLLTGKLIASNPGLLSGYYEMSKEERNQFDIKGKYILERIFYKWGFFIIGGTFTCFLFSWDMGKIVVIVSSVLIFSGIIYYNNSRHKHNSENE